jgi:hypothetical protein
MRKLTWPLDVLFAVSARMAASCEKKEEQQEALQTLLNELLEMYEKLAPMVE